MAHVEEKLRNLLEQIASEQGYNNYNLDITPISSGGGNYTSVLYKAKVKEVNKSDLDLFIKVGVMGEETRNTVDIQVFEAERYVYKTIRRIFTEIEDKYKVKQEDRLVMPIYYGSHSVVKEDILVLEDLTVKGYSVYDRLKSVDWPYASAAVRELAKFHALAIVFKKEYPDEHQTYCRNHNSDMFTDEVFDIMIKPGLSKTLESVRDENRGKLKKFFDTMDLQTVIALYRSYKMPVLTHGDYRPSNLMHRYKEDGLVELIPVDYQTLMEGSMLMDLLYFIINGTDAEFRRQYYQRLIDHYFTELTTAMNRLGLGSNFYTREDFDYELKEKLPYGLIITALSLPIVTIDFEDAPKIDEGFELSAIHQVKTSKLYVERLNGIVEDYVRWGILV